MQIALKKVNGKKYGWWFRKICICMKHTDQENIQPRWSDSLLTQDNYDTTVWSFTL